MAEESNPNQCLKEKFMAWQNAPFKIDVAPGDKKYFCACDKSKNGPYCDGSHKGTGKHPFCVDFTEKKTIHACGCGKSQKRPFCDGSHKK